MTRKKNRGAMRKIDKAAAACKAALWDLEKHFVKEARLTLLMRVPGNPECELLFTRDDLDGVIEALTRFKERSVVNDN